MMSRSNKNFVVYLEKGIFVLPELGLKCFVMLDLDFQLCPKIIESSSV